MKHFKHIYLSTIIVFLLFCCNNNEMDSDNDDLLNPTKHYEELDISYGTDDNQQFDLYLPANRTSNTKTVILVHGGGWSSGDKVDMDPFKDLIRQDFPNLAIVNINYRLADANNQSYPMQIDDITTIINHLKDKKTTYSISEKFGFIGVSAGAHLSLLWSYAFDTSNHINMVCSIVGPTNLTDPAYLNNTNPVLQDMLDLYGVSPEVNFLKDVSPYHQATASAPPTILFYGGQDPLIPTTQGTAMRDKLHTLGITHEFTLYPNGGHGWTGLDLLDTWFKLKVFMNTHL